MNVLTAKVLASLLQLHGPDATIQSDHQGIEELLGDVRGRISQNEAGIGEGDAVGATQVYFRRAGFLRGAAPGFRRGGGFVRGFRRF